MHHRGGSNRALPPPAMRAARGAGGGSRPSARSRSRSRSPPRGSGRGSSSARYSGGGRSERDSRDVRESRPERERDRDRERDRRRSISPYGHGGGSARDRDRKPSSSTTGNASKTSDATPSVSVIHTEPHTSIVRRIMNPEEVKIPRRVTEGSKPIFERDELREAMLRRMRNNDNEENPAQPNAYIQEPTVTQQRVVAIIREPLGGNPLDMYLSKDPALHHSLKITSTGTDAISERRTASYNRRSPSPRTIRQSSSGTRRPSAPGSPPPPQLSSSRARSTERDREQRERERIILERERALEREREQLIREREQHTGRERLPPPEREREFRERDRDLHRPDDRGERENRSRFSAGPPALQAHPRVEIRQRIRSRSPVTRVLREDTRLRRRSRSHSVTPPPMPDEFRQRLILERQKQIDLRSSLSRQPAKFGDDRVKGRLGPSTARGGGRGGRGGFPSRSVRGREDVRRAWVHDMYDGGDEPKKG